MLQVDMNLINLPYEVLGQSTAFLDSKNITSLFKLNSRQSFS
jgi:hypothetical protein